MRRVVAWSIYGVALALLIATATLWMANGGGTFTPHPFLVPTYGLVGAVIAARSRNGIGWLFLAFAGLCSLMAFLGPLDEYAQTHLDISIPDIGSVLWPSSFLFFGLVLLLFPTGHLPSPRWRWFFYVFVGSWGFAIAAAAIGGEDAMWAAPGLVLVADATLLVAALSPLARIRRANALERQQLRWIGFVLSLGAVTIVGAAVMLPISPAIGNALAFVPFLVGLIGIPGAVAVAILRYHLYDINVIINKALVYIALTIVLAGLYLGAVFVFQAVLSSVVSGNNVAVAASTLLVAAAFGPLRRRLQSQIDQRFYRRKYDSEQTIAAFAARLRDQINLEALTGELVSVVQSTFQPSQVSIWLRRTEVGA
jgi:hypothetical protein